MGMSAGMGSAMKAGSSIESGYQTKMADDYTATALNNEAGASVAAGAQGAILDRRRAAYIGSSALARASANGVSGSSPTVLNVMSQIKSQGEYNALTSIYQGQDRSDEIRDRSMQLQAAGSNAVTSGWISGMSNLLQSGSSFYSKGMS